VSESPNRVVALGSPTGEHRATIEAACRRASAELVITRDPPRALAEVQSNPTLAVLVDMAALGAENFCRKARASEQLRRVPIIGLSRNPGELSFNRVFAWGADDLAPLGQENPLAERLAALAESSTTADESFGQAVVAEANPERCTLLGRVLTQAGYSVKYAIDATSAEYYASQFETRLCVVNASLSAPRKLIETVEQSGALPMWVVIAEPRNLPKVVQSLSGVQRVAVTAAGGSPEDVLFVANELVFSRGNKRKEWRALYGTPVHFREANSSTDEFGFTYDISPNGIYVRSLLPCDFSEVWLELRPPRRDKLVRLRGKIARKFRYGSGSIASAPPGFGVKLDENDDEDLKTWLRACQDFLQTPAPPAAAAAGAAAKPAAFKSSSSALAAQDPAKGAIPRPLAEGRSNPEASLASTVEASPPAQVAKAAPTPPPVAPADEVDEVLGGLEGDSLGEGRELQHSDVGLMLAEALDQQELPASGALPVSMSFDRNDVFERVSALPPEVIVTAAKEAPKDPAPLASAPTTLPGPPAANPAGPPPPPVRTSLASATALPSAKATLMMGAPTPSRAMGAVSVPAASPPPSRAKSLAPPLHTPSPPALGSTAVMAAPSRSPTPAPVRVATPSPALASTAVMNQLANAPTPAAAMPKAEPPAADLSADALFPRATPNAETTFVSAQSPPPATKAVDVAVTTPGKTVSVARDESRDALTTKRAAAPKPRTSLPAASSTSGAAAPPTSSSTPATTKRRSRTPLLLVGLLLVGALAGATVFVARAKQGGVARPPATTASPPPRVTSTPVADTASAAPPESATAPVPSAMGSAETAPVPSAAPSASGTPVASGSPVASAAPEVASAAPEVASAAPPSPVTEPPAAPEVDLTKLAARQGYLFVRSSVSARVFVMANDVGETNAPLVVNCGTKFIRLGRALGEFIEPGGSAIIKCGALTELSREPR
jgi:DNA-binding response OmpR family regulator